MICDEAMRLMSAALDGELTSGEQEALQAHLHRCEDCRRAYDAMAAIDRELSDLSQPAPVGLKKGILYRIDQESGKTRAPRRRFFGAGTGFGVVAAVLVLLVGTGVIQLPSPKSARPEQSAEPAETQVLNLDQSENSYYGSVGLSGQDVSTGTVGNAVSEDPRFGSSLIADKNGSGLLGTDSSPEDYLPEETRQTVTAPDAAPAEPLKMRPVGIRTRISCQTVSAEREMPLLLYTEFSDESLFALLEESEPDLYDRVADFLPEEAPQPDPETGFIAYEMDYDTVLAVQEWLVSRIPAESEEDRPAAARLVELMEDLDPGSDSLYRVISWEKGSQEVDWPEIWPEDWARRFVNRENWMLCFPAEDAKFGKDAPALLVFQAPEK